MPDKRPTNQGNTPPSRDDDVVKPLDEAEKDGADVGGAGAGASATTPSSRGPVLIVAAHPDDPEFGCGATQAKYVAQGRKVVVAVVTSGEEGGEDPSIPDAVLKAQREDEQRRASSVIGVDTVEFLHYPDGHVANCYELKRDIVRLIRRHKPETIFTHDPTAHIFDGHINHPDHRAVGFATLDAIFPAAGNPRSYRELLSEGLDAHKINEVYLFFTASANVWIDVHGYVETKADALREHASQVKKPDEMKTRMLEGAQKSGEPHGVEAAEGFRRVVFHRG